MDALFLDLRQTIRSLVANPTFVVLSVVCLALGIGVNTTVFSVVNAVLLRPLPVADADRIVTLHEARREAPADLRPVSYPNFRDWQSHAAQLGELAALRPLRVNVRVSDGSTRYPAALVTWNLFPMLGLQPLAGRALREEDDRPGAAAVALISEAFWDEQFARDPAAIGRALVIDDEPHIVVGVMPRMTHPVLPGSLRGRRLWMPLTPVDRGRARDDRALTVFARFVAGLSSDDAHQRLAAIGHELAREHQLNDGWGISVRPLSGSMSATTQSLLLVISGAVAFVLLIACANVANLMLARATRRRREMAIRTAVGASHARIIRQLLLESVVVGAVSVPLGLLVASWGIGLFMTSAPQQTADVTIPMDARVLAFAIALAGATSLLFGMVPALQAIRGATRETLSGGDRSATATRQQKRLRGALVIGEVALSLVLLIGAALFVRSFLNLLHSEGDFDTSAVLTLRAEWPEQRAASGDALATEADTIVTRLESLPGVERAAASDLLPLRGGGTRTSAIAEPTAGERAPVSILYSGVTGGFFEALRLPIVRGRAITDLDARARAAVAVINERMAGAVWPGQDAIGRRFRLADDGRGEWFTVIGVSRDLSNWDLSNRALPTAYLPYSYAPVRDPRFVIRTAGNPAHVVAAIRGVIHAIDPAVAVLDVHTLRDVHRLAFWRNEMVGRLLIVFGVMAMLLAVIGVYGVLSYLVSQRTREIGVRIAMGARRADVVRLVTAQGMRLVMSGIAIGLLGAVVLGRVIRRQLFEVSAADPLSLAGVALLLTAVGFVASYLPAARAASVDPVTALRD